MNEEVVKKINTIEKNIPIQTMNEEDLSTPMDKASTQTIENAPAPGEECAP